jgi:KUP system potassium uptake protein
MEEADVPNVLREAADAGLETAIDVDDARYFLWRIELIPGDGPGMARWRKGLFVATSQITADAAEYFGLPRERTLIVGSQITV